MVETRHNTPVLGPEALESNQKNEETREISYNADAVRAEAPLPIVILHVNELICPMSGGKSFEYLTITDQW